MFYKQQVTNPQALFNRKPLELLAQPAFDSNKKPESKALKVKDNTLKP